MLYLRSLFIVHYIKGFTMENFLRNFLEVSNSKTMLFMLASCMAMMLTITNNNQAHAQEQNDTLALLIWVEDAVGNKDTVWVYVKSGASDYLDPELGEVNLYGIPVEGDLDIRLVQRTDTNYIDVFGNNTVPFWLVGSIDSVQGTQLYIFYRGWLRSYPENVDMKKNYVALSGGHHNLMSFWDFTRSFAFSIYAENYPIKICVRAYVESLTFAFTDWMSLTVYNGGNGTPHIDGTMSEWDTLQDICFDALNENAIIGLEPNNVILLLQLHPHVGIQDSIAHKTLYPNPVNDFVILNDISVGKYSIVDAVGNVVKEFNIETTPYQLDITKLSIGSYFITDNFRKYLFKFIKK
jgi:hypothetical protein